MTTTPTQSPLSDAELDELERLSQEASLSVMTLDFVKGSSPEMKAYLGALWVSGDRLIAQARTKAGEPSSDELDWRLANMENLRHTIGWQLQYPGPGWKPPPADQGVRDAIWNALEQVEIDTGAGKVPLVEILSPATFATIGHAAANAALQPLPVPEVDREAVGSSSDELRKVGYGVRLPEGYLYGQDAKEQVQLGAKLATDAIIALIQGRAG